MIRVQRPRTDQKTTAEKRQTVVCVELVEFVEFVECLLKSAPIHERANMHGGCRVEIEEEVRSSNSKDEPGIRYLGSDAMISPCPTATSW